MCIQKTYVSMYEWVWWYLSNKGLSQALIGITPDLGIATDGKEFILDR